MALQEALLVLRTLRQGRKFVSVRKLDPVILEGALDAAGLKEAPFLHLLPFQQLPEPAKPEFDWDDRDPSAQSDRWDSCFSLRGCVSADKRDSSRRRQHPLHPPAAAQPERSPILRQRACALYCNCEAALIRHGRPCSAEFSSSQTGFDEALDVLSTEYYCGVVEEEAHAHTCSSASCCVCLQVHPPSQEPH